MSMDIELAHDVEEETPHHRRLAILVGVAAIVAAMLGVLQMHASTEEGRSNTRSARSTAELTRSLEIFGLVGSFQLPTGQQLLADGLAANARALVAIQQEKNAQTATAFAEVENAVVPRLSAIIDAMAETPTAEDGVDPTTLETMGRDLEGLQALLKVQNAEVDRAERFGRRGDRAVLALSIVAVAAVLLGLGGIVGPGRPGSRVLLVAAIATTAALVTGGTALLI